MLLYLASAASSSDPTALSVDNPLVLGPIAAFIFTIFVTEIVVSGKAYRREVHENERLRALVEKVVPLAEQMVVATKDLIDVAKEASKAIEHFLDFMDAEGYRRGRR